MKKNVHFAALFPLNLALITHNPPSSVNPSIVNRYFFCRRHFRSFDDGSVRIKGEKTLFLSVCYSNKCLRLASEKFVSARGSNLSLVTSQGNQAEKLVSSPVQH